MSSDGNDGYVSSQGGGGGLQVINIISERAPPRYLLFFFWGRIQDRLQCGNEWGGVGWRGE